ncbi:MAG: hypothetical protein ACI8QZ_004362 [Chlamydiales bacterium]|jgi:hypothetical protein
MKKTMDTFTTLFLMLTMLLSPGSMAYADPCGMVPPLWLGDGAPITRIGAQKTYVFYKDGIETFVIRPGFSGQIDQFGMLIPFPSPPTMRKVGEDVFGHIGAAIDPPEVVVDLRMRALGYCEDADMPMAAKCGARLSVASQEQEVVVLRQEAVGMYEIAVLDAGSAGALKLWMDDHDFRFPTGMDQTCDEYIEEGWCFVAVRARVGTKSGSEPRPGMREVDTALPSGAGFDGHVQAMGFRFRTDEMVLPMRLSAFNPGELRNIVYILSDTPQRIANLPEQHVVRQIPGWTLYRNMTEPLPVRIVGGHLSDIPDWRRKNLPVERNPIPFSGIARDLFASDLLAAREDRLAHPHEEMEKTLLEIGERLGLRNPAMDALHREALAKERDGVIAAALQDLRGMTLTVIDGDFEREVLAAENLSFATFNMPYQDNSPRLYDAKHLGPAPVQTGSISDWTPGGPGSSGFAFAFSALALLAFGAWKMRGLLVRVRPAVTLVAVTLAATLSTTTARADVEPDAQVNLLTLVEEMAYPITDGETVRVLVACGPDAIPRLIDEGTTGSTPASRGWAIVALTEFGTAAAREGLMQIEQSSDSALVRTWALAAQIKLAPTTGALLELSQRGAHDPNLERPLRQSWSARLASGGIDGERVLEHVLEAASYSSSLQQALLPSVLRAGVAPLVRVLTEATTVNARNLAAACLATLAGQGEGGVAQAVIDAYRFDPRAEVPAWDGGPLFLPGLSWSGPDARELTRNLIAWFVWCDTHQRTGECTQLHNNLRSLNLAQAAGYESPAWEEIGVEQWLVVWGRSVGSDAVKALLVEQGLEQTWRFSRVLKQIEALDR